MNCEQYFQFFSSGPEVIKLFSSSAQLSMKFKWPINAEIVTIGVENASSNLKNW